MGLYEGIKDVARVVQQADNIELYKQLLDLSAQALDLQKQVCDLTEENAKLKKQEELESRIERHSGLYLTLKGENSILYCAHCWDSERKLIQMFTGFGRYNCPHCHIEDIYDEKNL